MGTFATDEIRESGDKHDNQYLAASDVAGVALAGVQELMEQNRMLSVKIEQLEKRIAELENK